MNVDRIFHSTSISAELSPAPPSATPGKRLGFVHPKRADRPLLSLCGIAALVALGSLDISPTVLPLWDLWTRDPLRSIGMLILLASLVLITRVWWQTGWELRGTSWGLLPVALAFSLQYFEWYWIHGILSINLLPITLPLCLYACGVILLFAGLRVCRLAWFPLALLLFVQAMPVVGSRLIDLPLQSLSAHVARSFASLIGFAPMTPQLLKLMFTPDFGMFIAPGCDGLRGAITLGYIALIVGYLRRVSFWKWLLYVIGAVLLGYLFNLLRLCALVVYYRIAVGHPALEGVAKQADYGIGACLILVAAILLFWIATRVEVSRSGTGKFSILHPPAREGEQKLNTWRIAAFALVTLLFAIPSARATQNRLETLQRIGGRTPQQLNDLMPKQLGEYKQNRAWQETLNGANVVESAAYAAPGSGEVVLGVFLLPVRHSVHFSWITHGLTPELRANREFATAMGKIVSFDSAFYSDGITDSFVADAMCTSSSCLPSQLDDGIHMAFRSPRNFSMRGTRAVPILFRVESLQSDLPKNATREALSAQAQRFLHDVDFSQISQSFQ